MVKADWPILDRVNSRFGLIGSGWSVLLLGTTLSSTYISFQIVGYRWSSEFVLGCFLLLGYAILARSNAARLEIDTREFRVFLIPLVLFALWSGFSIFWARSIRGAVHHTLLWAGFILFYLLTRQGTARVKDRERSLKIASLAASIVAGSGLIVYLGYTGPTDLAFNSRYYLLCETLVPLMPVFICLAATRKTRRAWLFGGPAVLIWLLMLVTASRAMFVSGALVLIIFAAGSVLSRGFTPVTKRILAISGLIVLLWLPQVLAPRSDSTVAGRFSTENSASTESARSRLVFWGLALEGFKSSPITGIGAGNYFAEYSDLRRSLAAKIPDSPLLGIAEDAIPERAHNEYLQILGELGLIGICLFGAALIGLGVLFFGYSRTSLLSIAAFAGIIGFLASSFVSSYSFRFPVAGVSFFFLAALMGPNAGPVKKLGRGWATAASLIAISIIGFSVVRGSSVYYFSQSVGEQNPELAESLMRTALRLDPDEPMFRHYYGQMLNLWGRSGEAESNIEFAVDHGMANSTSYFVLAQTYVLGGKLDKADNVFQTAVKVYPRSVFLRTAYSNFLLKSGDVAKATVSYEIAEEIDAVQARSWQLAHGKGLEALSLAKFRDPTLLTVGELLPADGPLVLDNFERARDGRERITKEVHE